MTITRLDPSHAHSYRELMLRAYATHPDAFTSSHAQRAALPMQWWQSRLSHDTHNLEVVFGYWVNAADQNPALTLGSDDLQLAGVVGVAYNQSDKTLHKAQVFGMYVDPQHRQHGIAKALLNVAMNHAKARAGVRILQLTVTQGNHTAHRLYETQGFTPFGIEPMAVAQSQGFVNKVHMWCDLAVTAAV